MGNHMKRNLLKLVILSASLAVAGLSTSALAQDKPTVKIMVGFPPGGSVDVVARLLAEKLRVSLDQNVIVENKPGAAGRIALGELKRASTDGNTLALVPSGGLVIMPWLFKNLGYDPVKDFSVVGLTIAGYPILMVNSQLGIKTVPELIAYMKAKNTPADCGGSGTATVGHFVCAAFAVRTGNKMQYVPYKSNVAAMTDAASGQVQLVSAFYSEVAPFIASGKLIPLGVFGANRLPLLPNVPTMEEQGLKDLELQSYTVYAVPTGTPVAAQRRLNAAILKAANHPDVMDKVKLAGGVYFDMNLEETQAWQKRIQSR